MKLIKSFAYALAGVGYCLRRERNFRIHLVAAVTVLAFAWLYGLEAAGYPAVILAIALVLTVEAVNTALERAVDLAAPDRSPLAKAAKDAAAAAVLLSALGAVGVACFTFRDVTRLAAVLRCFAAPGPLAGLLVYILAMGAFVFLPCWKDRNTPPRQRRK